VHKLALFLLLFMCFSITTTAYPYQSIKDTDHDGFPDSIELVDETERSNFRRWFVSIAQSQFYYYHPHWPDVRRDCTGLICFAYKEALKTHDKEWFKRFKYLTNTTIPDIKTYRYPAIPLIGADLFRGSAPTTVNGQMALKNGDFLPIVTAPILMQYNCQYLGKELDETIEAGDILFFHYHNQDNINDLYHAMILVKTNRHDSQHPDGEVVYHTGPDGQNTGEVRQVQISTLNNHPDDTWHIKADNPHFLGFFRFNILDYHHVVTGE